MKPTTPVKDVRNGKPTHIRPHECCDCHRPTPDHRCPKCLKEWRKKHNVPENPGSFGFEDI